MKSLLYYDEDMLSLAEQPQYKEAKQPRSPVTHIPSFLYVNTPLPWRDEAMPSLT